MTFKEYLESLQQRQKDGCSLYKEEKNLLFSSTDVERIDVICKILKQTKDSLEKAWGEKDIAEHKLWRMREKCNQLQNALIELSHKEQFPFGDGATKALNRIQHDYKDVE